MQKTGLTWCWFCCFSVMYFSVYIVLTYAQVHLRYSLCYALCTYAIHCAHLCYSPVSGHNKGNGGGVRTTPVVMCHLPGSSALNEQMLALEVPDVLCNCKWIALSCSERKPVSSWWLEARSKQEDMPDYYYCVVFPATSSHGQLWWQDADPDWPVSWPSLLIIM